MNSLDIPIQHIHLLKRQPYFAALDDTILRSIAASTLSRSYSTGQVVLIEGEACAGLFIVRAGRVKITRSSLEGREQIVHFAGPGEAFNDVPVFDGGPNPATVQAIQDSVLLLIERAVMVDLFDRYPQLAQSVVQVLATRCRQLLAMIKDLSLHTVTTRLAGLLLDYAQDPHAPTLTRAQMAARLGTVREVVSRSLRELEQDQLIRLEGSNIVITNQAGLTQRANR